MRVTRFDHVTIAVRDLDEALQTFLRLFNLQAVDRRRVDHMAMENAFVPLGDTAIELVQPLADSDSPGDVERTLERRGEGLMNLCLTVENLDEAVAHLETCGARVIRRQDADGDPIAFVHPKDAHGVLIELRTGKRHIRGS
jgi:methylmalonyl-CoA/ethylmalonyl-CoA epimerase